MTDLTASSSVDIRLFDVRPARPSHEDVDVDAELDA
jgi:hypothetical protein